MYNQTHNKGLDMNETKRSIIWKIEKKELQHLLDAHDSFSSIMRHFGLSPADGSIKTLYSRIKEDGLDDSRIRNDKPWTKSTSTNNRVSDEDAFCENSTYNRAHVKGRIIKKKLLPHVCRACGNAGDWNGNPITLQLEHINGIPNDNRLENLCFLCPNCHSQTKTYAGRKTKHIKIRSNCKTCGKVTSSSKIEKCSKCRNIENRKFNPPLTELITLVCEEKLSFAELSRRYKVTDTTVKKRCRLLGIDVKKRIYSGADCG